MERITQGYALPYLPPQQDEPFLRVYIGIASSHGQSSP
jgi:hypothetical protein